MLSILGALLVPLVSAIPTQPPAKCTAETAVQRKEWSSLTPDERIAYTDAITCLMSKPSIYAPGAVPASTNFYSDFAASHANISLSIHQTGTFLSWHREFLHLMETALHEQCGYPSCQGLPYWDWALYTSAPLEESTLFDGSPTSLGGNGLPIPNRPPHTVGPAEAAMLNNEAPAGSTLPVGSGGGCVVTGPFAHASVSLGPFPAQYIFSGLPENWTDANPHCFTRDLNDLTFARFGNESRIDELLASPGIETFQYEFNPIHRGGHFSVGGPLADFYVSPLDPTFWLHHGQIDRLWAIWQEKDESRRGQYNGTSTFLNPIGVTPEVDGETLVNFFPLGEDIMLKEAADPMAGKYCYRYV